MSHEGMYADDHDILANMFEDSPYNDARKDPQRMEKLRAMDEESNRRYAESVLGIYDNGGSFSAVWDSPEVDLAWALKKYRGVNPETARATAATYVKGHRSK